jgi:hypothetical protein
MLVVEWMYSTLGLTMMRRGKEFANAPSASSLSGVTMLPPWV